MKKKKQNSKSTLTYLSQTRNHKLFDQCHRINIEQTSLSRETYTVHNPQKLQEFFIQQISSIVFLNHTRYAIDLTNIFTN